MLIPLIIKHYEITFYIELSSLSPPLHRIQVEKLRGSIQTLTRSANPLGKIMDYVQEDLHSMQKERDTWRSENKKLRQQIKQEMR